MTVFISPNCYRFIFKILNKNTFKVDSQLAEIFLSLGTDPDVSPIFGISENLPPTMVLTAEYDILK